MKTYWLPPIADWRSSIRAAEQRDPADPALWDALVHLAGHQLDALQTERLDRLLVARFGEPPAGLTTKPVRLAVLGSSTLTHLLPALRVAALRRGLWVTTVTADYGIYRQVLAGAAPLGTEAPTACLLALDARHVVAGIDPNADAESAAQAVDHAIEDLRRLWRQARALCDGQVIQQTLLPVFAPLMGQNEHRLPGSPAALVARINERLRGAAAEEGVDLLAIDARVGQDGLDRWHDPLLWHRAKQEVSPGAAPGYGELAARLLAAAQGRSAKCLVLDLDNTLWGGVIGDDGLDGIVVGQGSAAGEAFAAFQDYAAALARRGVILAVCSKNDEANAVEAFDKHPDMVLRRGDIASFRANWTDKATNIRAIAAELNIGLDSLVFVDDNPFERALVRGELPMVQVPEVPEDPALFARCVADAGYFEALSVTRDDADRTRQYADNRERAALLSEATDMGAYLRSLDMQLRWKRVDRLSLGRVTQLINKTNQFNLTTRRYTEEQVAAMIADPRHLVMQLRLVDRLGDNGIIAVVIGVLDNHRRLDIDSWLMSCRVLGRQVEEATMGLVMAQARGMGAHEIVGRYRPTAKNAMVAGLYARLGFEADAQAGPDGDMTFRAAVAEPAADLPFTITEE